MVVNAKPGEICSIDQAMRLGLYDYSSKKYVDGMEDTRNYSRDNPEDYKRRKTICKQTTNEDIAYPLCPVEMGLGFTQMKGDPSRCVTYDCPPGFTDIGENRCKKPDNPMIIDKTRECGEKMYDWYSIRNYHLGNKYQKLNEKCMRPCPVNSLPLKKTDPVDNTEWDITLTNPEGTKCVPKANYMNGKYAQDQDFCPIAVVKKLGTTPDILYNEMMENAQEILAKIPNRTKAARDIQRKLAETSVEVAMGNHRELEQVKSGSTQFQIACEKMVTTDELSQAYEICRNIKYTPGKITSAWRSELMNNDADVKVKKNVLENACHEVFCNKKENAMELGEQPLCFVNLKKEDTTAYNQKYAGAYVDPSIPKPLKDNKITTPSIPQIVIQDAKGVPPSTSFMSDFINQLNDTVRYTILAVFSIAMILIIIRLIRIAYKKMQGDYCSSS